jgi:hypothetical protein
LNEKQICVCTGKKDGFKIEDFRFEKTETRFFITLRFGRNEAEKWIPPYVGFRCASTIWSGMTKPLPTTNLPDKPAGFR